jgi:hypothetical protein
MQGEFDRHGSYVYYYRINPPIMPNRSKAPENIPSEALERIKAEVLKKEESMLHYRRPPKIRPDLKEIVEEEIDEDYLD